MERHIRGCEARITGTAISQNEAAPRTANLISQADIRLDPAFGARTQEVFSGVFHSDIAVPREMTLDCTFNRLFSVDFGPTRAAFAFCRLNVRVVGIELR